MYSTKAFRSNTEISLSPILSPIWRERFEKSDTTVGKVSKTITRKPSPDLRLENHTSPACLTSEYFETLAISRPFLTALTVVL